MSPPDQMLPDEEVLFHTSPHWILFASPGMLIATAFLSRPYVGVYADWILIAGASALFGLFLRRITTTVWVTDQRIIAREGIVKRHTDSILLRQVESLRIDQSLLGRILNYGTLEIKGTGHAWAPLRSIARPAEIRTRVHEEAGQWHRTVPRADHGSAGERPTQTGLESCLSALEERARIDARLIQDLQGRLRRLEGEHDTHSA